VHPQKAYSMPLCENGKADAALQKLPAREVAEVAVTGLPPY
jgi:hypothetical protein